MGDLDLSPLLESGEYSDLRLITTNTDDGVETEHSIHRNIVFSQCPRLREVVVSIGPLVSPVYRTHTISPNSLSYRTKLTELTSPISNMTAKHSERCYDTCTPESTRRNTRWRSDERVRLAMMTGLTQCTGPSIPCIWHMN